jgi:hypothetical protein
MHSDIKHCASHWHAPAGIYTSDHRLQHKYWQQRATAKHYRWSSVCKNLSKLLGVAFKQDSPLFAASAHCCHTCQLACQRWHLALWRCSNPYQMFGCARDSCCSLSEIHQCQSLRRRLHSALRGRQEKQETSVNKPSAICRQRGKSFQLQLSRGEKKVPLPPPPVVQAVMPLGLRAKPGCC